MAGPKKSAKMGHNKQEKKVVFGEKVRYIQMGGQKAICKKCGNLLGKDSMVVRYPEKNGDYYCNWGCSWQTS